MNTREAAWLTLFSYSQGHRRILNRSLGHQPVQRKMSRNVFRKGEAAKLLPWFRSFALAVSSQEFPPVEVRPLKTVWIAFDDLWQPHGVGSDLVFVSTSSETPLVRIENFLMHFGKRTVLKDLSFEVGREETFGFLDSNGLGKTTTIRALLGIYQPTAGSLLIDGRPFPRSTVKTSGICPRNAASYRKESVIDVMTYLEIPHRNTLS